MTPDLMIWSHRNWRRIPELVRQDCLNELRAIVPQDVLIVWCEEFGRTGVLGNDEPWFHSLGAGMAVRNLLRRQYTDGELPPVKYDDGVEYRNWDDFYLGALMDLCTTATVTKA